MDKKLHIDLRDKNNKNTIVRLFINEVEKASVSIDDILSDGDDIFIENKKVKSMVKK